MLYHLHIKQSVSVRRKSVDPRDSSGCRIVRFHQPYKNNASGSLASIIKVLKKLYLSSIQNDHLHLYKINIFMFAYMAQCTYTHSEPLSLSPNIQVRTMANKRDHIALVRIFLDLSFFL